MKRKQISDFCEEYFKHTALNFGQTLQGIRTYSHPNIDRRWDPRYMDDT